jgi:3-hydroxy acid dehydrogenase/malonic semialdehyde reductase
MVVSANLVFTKKRLWVLMMQTAKTVLISGASSGIGFACCELFARAGWRLIVLARRADRLEKIKQQCSPLTDVYCLTCDIQNQQAVEEAVANCPSEWQTIDLLVNNAGLAAGLATTQAASLDDWEQMIDTNVKGLLYLTRACLPGMLQRQQGHIINIGSIAGREVYPKGNVYCATKFAVRALTQGMREDLLGSGVRVSEVAPGMVETEFSLVRFKQDSQKSQSVYAGMQPLRASDVAQAVLYCAQQPEHVCVAEMLIMPTAQASATRVDRAQPVSE